MRKRRKEQKKEKRKKTTTTTTKKNIVKDESNGKVCLRSSYRGEIHGPIHTGAARQIVGGMRDASTPPPDTR